MQIEMISCWLFNSNHSSQDADNCSPKGRDCIETEARKDFNCSVSCEGIYADVQWTEDMLGEEEERQEKKMELMGEMEREQEKANRVQLSKLVDEYNLFKTNVRHFRFDATTNSPVFGEASICFSYI